MPTSARGKSFAQHLLEIEQEAARAASRIRLAHNKANQALPGYDPQSDPLLAARAGGPAIIAAEGSTAEIARLRCELRALRACLPELEEEYNSLGQLWQVGGGS